MTVGHPDTGYTPHPELADAARLLHEQGFDFDDDDPDPIDDLDDDFLVMNGDLLTTIDYSATLVTCCILGIRNIINYIIYYI